MHGLTKEHRRGAVKSPSFSFLSIPTDGRSKKEHNEVLALVLEIFKKAGMNHYNISHIDDPERIKSIPLKFDGHVYDLAVEISKGRILLLEVRLAKWQR